MIDKLTVNQARDGNCGRSLEAGQVYTRESTADITSGNEFVVEPDFAIGHTQTIQEALDLCSSNGGGRVVLRPGVHYSGTIHLRSHVTLHLEKDALLLGSTNIDDYGRKTGKPGARILNGVGTALVFAEKADDIAITGEGTIDGNGRAFRQKNESIPDWVNSKKEFGIWIPGFVCGMKERPMALVMFLDCTNVRLETIRVQHSPSWMIHLLACTNMIIRGITLRGFIDGANTDGIDLDACSDVLVEDCDIESGDDAIALKNTDSWGLKRVSRNITVRRCRLRSTTHGFTIGGETQESFEDIVLADCQIEKAGDYRLLTGIGLSIVDGADVRRLRISNVTISDAVGSIQIRQGNVGRGQLRPTPGILEDITFENISILRAYGNNMILGLPGHPLSRISLRNIRVDFIGLIDSGKVPTDFPQQANEYPDNHAWRYLPAYGFYCRDIRDLELSNISFTAPAAEKRPDLVFKNVSGLSVKGKRPT